VSGPVVHVGAGVTCTHAGPVSIAPGSPRVQVGGQPVATMSDNFSVTGCAFTLPSGTPHPCMRIQWTVPAARVQVLGQPVITQGSVGLGLAADCAPQGPPMLAGVQPRVVAQ
jgi:hypothetical protein